MRKTAAAAAMAASLTVGAGAGALLFAPDLVNAAQTDDSTTTTEADPGTDESSERREPGQFLEEALAPMVDDGTLTQDQADAVVEALRDARPDGRFGHGGPGGPFGFGDGEVLDLLGLTAEELRTALEDGQTLAEVAEANGVSVDELVTTIVSGIEERLDQAVENGRITAEDKDDKLAEATERVTEAVNGEIEFDGHRRGPFGRGHGPFGGSGDDSGSADSGDDTTGS